MKKIMLTVCSAIFALSAQNAFADMEQHQVNQNSNPMTQEYIKAMDDMHKPMMDGIMATDPDVAFVQGMIPHHQGAIAMAKIELKYGTDPKIKALAQEVIKAQEQEITMMQQWLESHKTK